jgi:hypothetical protein
MSVKTTSDGFSIQFSWAQRAWGTSHFEIKLCFVQEYKWMLS